VGEPEGNRRLYPATNSKFKILKFKTKAAHGTHGTHERRKYGTDFY
jgi:hypothetical protein